MRESEEAEEDGYGDGGGEGGIEVVVCVAGAGGDMAMSSWHGCGAARR